MKNTNDDAIQRECVIERDKSEESDSLNQLSRDITIMREKEVASHIDTKQTRTARRKQQPDHIMKGNGLICLTGMANTFLALGYKVGRRELVHLKSYVNHIYIL